MSSSPLQYDFDVLIYHSSKDGSVVQQLAIRLVRDGLRVTLADEAQAYGHPERLRADLNRSRVLILAMSKASMEKHWPAIEQSTFMFRDPANAGRRFVPVRLDASDVPQSLRQFAHVDWRSKSEHEYARLHATCRPANPTPRPIGLSGRRADGATKVLRGHTARVQGVAVSTDGTRALSCSLDQSVRLWDVATGRTLAELKGHTAGVNAVAFSPDARLAVSGADDHTVRLWDLKTRECIASLTGHNNSVEAVAFLADGLRIVSGSADHTVRVWDVAQRACTAILDSHDRIVWAIGVGPGRHNLVSASLDMTLRLWDLNSRSSIVLHGHSQSTRDVAVAGDHWRAVSVSADQTVRVWDLRERTCTAVLEGHTRPINGVAITPDGRRAASVSDDRTIRVWDLDRNQCIATLEGHAAIVRRIALSTDGRLAVSASEDQTLRVWELPPMHAVSASKTLECYTNAKVVLVGESGVGKSGLALRLAEDRWEVTESTHGMGVWKLDVRDSSNPNAAEREIWLWDFAGQPDYRLVHQLFMDETALALLVFDPQNEKPFDTLGHWEKAVRIASKHDAPKLLVAARCDRGGAIISEKQLATYQKEHGFAGYFATAAKTGQGCITLREAIAEHVPWHRLPSISTSKLFKTLKDTIIKVRESSVADPSTSVLVSVSALRQHINVMLPGEVFTEDQLRTVILLLAGQGLLHILGFGDVVLLQPEWLNTYASAVVRAAREHSDEMGAVSEREVLEGRIPFKDMKRLRGPDEQIMLRALVQLFVERAMCLRQPSSQGDLLVFPSHFRRDRPELPNCPPVVVSYGFAGPIDDIYSTLVVRLHYTEPFEVLELWKDAADYRTPTGNRVGLRLQRGADGVARIEIYFDPKVADDTKVTFIKYVHEHLSKRAQQVTRERSYVCPSCSEPVQNARAISQRLAEGKQDVTCVFCDKRIPLRDAIEAKFASPEAARAVVEMETKIGIRLDTESLELVLVGHAYTAVAEANQIYRGYTNSDHGIDGEIEFRNDRGEASGERLYLQLKSGDSYLRIRQDGQEVFQIKNPRHRQYWQSQRYPVMLVIRTSDGRIRWMNISEYLKADQNREAKQVKFEGEPFTAFTIASMRDKLLKLRPETTPN